MIVASDGSGDFTRLQDALDAIPAANRERICIHLKKGIYKQKIRITKPYVHLIGEAAPETVLTYDDYAKRLLPDGGTMNTFNSYTVYIGAPDFTAENLTIENAAGSGKVVGQAVAAYVDADRAIFRKCRFLGHQDTLFTGPLPKNPAPLGLNLIHPTLGSGPAEYPGILRQYYEDCFIRGDIDFIFGSATAVFHRCEIFANDQRETVNGYITAGSTPARHRFGYVFLDCRLTGEAGPHSVYLGRPWRDYANVAFINCRMGAHIIPQAWHNWDKPDREKTVTYLESGSTGPGANNATRVKWARILTPVEAKDYTVENILGGPDQWNPEVRE